jgi:hypothetical protein
MSYPIDPLARMFPLIEGQALEDCVIDVDLHGVREAVTLYQGRIIDGQNRQRWLELANERRASRWAAAGKERVQQGQYAGSLFADVPRTWLVGADDDEVSRYLADVWLEGEPRQWVLPTKAWDERGSLVEFIWSKNVHRRQLTESLRAMFAARAAPLLEEEARVRQLSGLKNQPGRSSVAPGTNGRTREKAAQMAGVSPGSVARARKVLLDGVPELAIAVEQGVISVNRAAEISKLPAKEQLKRIKEQGRRAAQQVKEADARDLFEHWMKTVAKLARQFAGFEFAVPRLVKWAGQGERILLEERLRVLE